MFASVYGSYSNIAGKQEEIEMFDKLEDLLIRLEEILSELQNRMWQVIQTVSVSS